MMRFLASKMSKLLFVILVETLLLTNGKICLSALMREGPGIEIDIPEKIGRIIDHYDGKDERFVIHIEDAHCNTEAQQQIYRILSNLFYFNPSFSFIGIEGAASTIDTSEFYVYPDKSAKWNASLAYVREGRINGAELFCLNIDDKIYRPPSLEGIETPYLYAQNFRAFSNAYPILEEGKFFTSALSNMLNSLKPYIYNKNLQFFDLMVDRYEHKAISFYDYCMYLYQQAKKANISIDDYNEFIKVHDSITAEQKLNITLKTSQEKALVDLLVSKMKNDDKNEWNTLYSLYLKDMVSAKYYYSKLQDAAKKQAVSIENYPELKKFIEFVKLSSKINQEILVAQIADIKEDILNKFFISQDERKFYYFSKNLSILNKMLALEITGKEFSYYLDNKEDFSVYRLIDFIKNYASKNNVNFIINGNTAAVEKAIPFVEEFYDIASGRDKILVDNALSEMEIAGANVGIVITGGFHTAGVTELLKEKGISYISIMPNITKIQDDNPYIDLMLGTGTPLETLLLARETGSLAVPSMMAKEMLMGTSNQQVLKDRFKLLMIADSVRNLIAGQKDLSAEQISDIINVVNGYIAQAGYDNVFSVASIDTIKNENGVITSVTVKVNYSGKEIVFEYGADIPFSQVDLESLEKHKQGDMVLRILSPQGSIVNALRINELKGENGIVKIDNIADAGLRQFFENYGINQISGINNLSLSQIVDLVRAIENNTRGKIGEFGIKVNKVDGKYTIVVYSLSEQQKSAYNADLELFSDSPFGASRSEVENVKDNTWLNNNFPQVSQVKQAFINGDFQKAMELLDQINEKFAGADKSKIVMDFSNAEQVRAVGNAIHGIIISLLKNEFQIKKADRSAVFSRLDQIRKDFLARSPDVAGRDDDINIADIGMGEGHGAINLLIGDLFANKTLVENKDFFRNEGRGEIIYFFDELAGNEQAGHAGFRRNAVYAANPAVAAHELAELRIWRAFAKSVLGFSDEQLKNGELRDWIKNMMRQSPQSRELVEIQLYNFAHKIAQIVQDRAAKADLSKKDIGQISDIVDQVLAENSAEIASFFLQMRQDMEIVNADSLGSMPAGFDILFSIMSNILPVAGNPGNRVISQLSALKDNLANLLSGLTVEQRIILAGMINNMISVYSAKTGESVPAINQQLQEIKSVIADSIKIKSDDIGKVDTVDVSPRETDAVKTDVRNGIIGKKIDVVDLKTLGNVVMLEAMGAEPVDGYAEVNMVISKNGDIIYLSNNPELPSSIKDLVEANEAFLVSIKIKVDLYVDGLKIDGDDGGDGDKYIFSSSVAIPTNYADVIKSLANQVDFANALNNKINQLASLDSAQGKLLSEFLKLNINNPARQLIMRKLFDLAGDINGIGNLDGTSIVSAFFDALYTQGIGNLTENDRSLSLARKIEKITDIITEFKFDDIAQNSGLRNTYLANLYFSLTEIQKKEVDSMFESGQSEWVILKHMERLINDSAIANSLKNKAYIEIQFENYYSQIGRTPVAEEMEYNIALIFANLQELQNSRLSSSKATINSLIESFVNGALLQKQLMNEALKKQYFDTLINALLAGELDKANMVLDRLKSRSFDARILDSQSLGSIVTALMSKIQQVQNLSIQEQMNIISFFVDLTGVIAIDFTSFDKLESQVKQLAENIINNSQTDLVTKLNVISKLREFYTSIGIESDNAYIQSLEAIIKGANQQRAMIGRVDAELNIISNYEDYMEQRLVLLHGSPNPNLQVGDIEITGREGKTKQGKRGRSYGGFYALGIDNLQGADRYSKMQEGTPTIYEVIINPNAKIYESDRPGEVERLSEQRINELVAQGYSIVRGPNIMGTVIEWAIIDKSAILEIKKTTPEGVTALQQINKLKERIFDIETNDKISSDIQSALITALITIYRNNNLSQNDKEALADNLMSIFNTLNTLDNISEQQKLVLLHYAANLSKLTFSEESKPDLKDVKISVSQLTDIMNSILNLADKFGNDFVDVLEKKGIEFGKNLPNLATRLPNGTIRIDIRALSNAELFQTVLLRQVLAQRYQLDDSLTDKLILDTLILDFINKEFDATSVTAINNFLLSDILSSLAQVSDFTAIKTAFDLASDRRQQLSILIDYLVKQSYREQGYTDLEISKFKDEISQKANEILSLVITRVNNLDIHKNSSIDFKTPNTLVIKRSAGADIDVKLSDELRGQIKQADIAYASYEVSSNQLRILTNDNRILVLDVSTGVLLFETKFVQVLDGTSMDILINRQIRMEISKARSNGKIISGLENGKIVTLQSRSFSVIDVLKNLFAEEEAGSPILEAISNLESGNIDVIVVDSLPGKLADGNEFISAYKDIRTGKGTIFISKTAWEKLDPYALEARDPKVDAFMAALLKSALLINGQDFSELQKMSDWRSQNNWITLNEHYNALFFHEMELDEQMRQAIASEVDKMNERVRAIQEEREKLARQLLAKKDELRAKSKERAGQIPSIKFSLGGKNVEVEQWNIEEIDGRKFMFLSFGEDIGAQILIDINSLTEMKFNDFIISKAGDQIQINYSKGGLKQTANLLTDINGNSIGVALSSVDSKGNIVTHVYDSQGNQIHNFTRTVSTEISRVPDGFSLADAKSQIEKLEQSPKTQQQQEQMNLLKLQYVNAVLAQYNSYIDSADGVNVAGIYDDMVNKGVNVQQVIQNGAVKSLNLSTIVIDNVKYHIKDGKLEQFDFSNIDSESFKEVPLSYVSGNTLVVFDSQGMRYEFALSNSDPAASTQFEAGQLIGVFNMADSKVQARLGIDLNISEDYKNKHSEAIDRIDQEIKQLEDDIRRYERLQQEALKTQDPATAQLTAQKYYIEILKKQIQITQKNRERLETQEAFLAEQSNYAGTHYRKAVAENQPESVIAQYLAIQKAYSSQLQAISGQKQKLNERLTQLQEAQRQAEMQRREQGEKDFVKEGESAPTINNHINNEIEKHIKNNTLNDFLLQLGQDGEIYELTLEDGQKVSIDKSEFRERLLDKDVYKNIISFLKGLDLTSKQEVEKVLFAVIRITFDRPGAASMTSEYELAILSEVQARAKQAGLDAKAFQNKAQEYLAKQEYVISSRGKERDPIQTKKLTEENKKTILKKIYGIIESIISPADKAIVNSEILNDTRKNRAKMIDELLEIEMLEKGSAEYNRRLGELRNLSKDQLYRAYTLLKSLSLQDAEFGANYEKVRKSSATLIAQILALENLKEGDEGYAERLKELEEQSKNATEFQNLVIHYLALSYLKKNLITPASDNFADMMNLLTKADKGKDYLKKALLVEHILKMKVDQKLQSAIKKEDRKLSTEEIARKRAAIESSLEILTDRSKMLKKDMNELQDFLREEFIRSGKYEEQLNEHLAKMSKDLQKQAQKYDLIKGNVPQKFIMEAYSAVMLSLMAEKGFFYHDVQLYAATLLANGGVINVGTGEGKTLTSAMALYLHSLSGETAVQFLTQESFARSDATSVKGLLGRLGVDVSVVTKDTDRKTVKEAFMRKADREKAGLPTTPRVVYTPFSDFAFIKLEDLKYAKDSKILPEELAYANFDEIDALVFEGSLMDFINADPSDPLKTEDVQVYRLIWDFVLKIRGDGAQLETVKDTDPEYKFLQNMMDGFKKVDDGSLFVLSKDKTSIQLKDQTKILIKELHKKAREQGYSVPDIAKFEELVRITLEQHFFHKEKVNWTFEPKKDENGEIVKDKNNQIVYEVKLINTQGEHTTQRQSHHRHTIIEVWSKYYLGKNVEILGDSETTGKIGGADVIKSFIKFSGFSGSIATEVAREELKNLYGKDSIAEIPSSIQKVIDRKETGVFTTKEERNAYLLSQIEDILKNRDGAPILAGTKDYQEAEVLYNLYIDRLETMAEEDLRKAVDILPEKRREKLLEKIKQFRDAKAVRAEGDDASVIVKSELAQEIQAELQKYMLASYLNQLSAKRGRIDEILAEVEAKIKTETDAGILQQLQNQKKSLLLLQAEFQNDINKLKGVFTELSKLYTILDDANKSGDSKTAKQTLGKIEAQLTLLKQTQAAILERLPSDYHNEFLQLGLGIEGQKVINDFLKNVDRLSKAYTFHGNSFKTEEEEAAFLELAGLQGSVTFVNPYGTRGKDFKLTKFDMGQFDKVINSDIVKKALADFFRSNPEVLSEIAALVAEDAQELTEIKNLLSYDLNTGLYMVLTLLVDRFDNDRDLISRKGRENKIIQFFGIMQNAVSTNVANPIYKDLFISQLQNALQSFRIERSHGYQVFEVGISLSERITMQLFGRGGRQKAPRTEQTLISLDVDQSQIAAKGFEGLGTNEGQRKLRSYLSQVENLNNVKAQVRETLIQMGINESQVDSVLTEILTFNRAGQLNGLLRDLSMQVLSALISEGKNERDAQEDTAKFIATLKNASIEDLQKQSFIDQAEKLGLSRSHIDRIIQIRFKETSSEASSQIISAILLDRAADYFRSKLTEAERKLSQNAQERLVAQRARAFVDNLKTRNDFETDQQYESYLESLYNQYDGLNKDFFVIDQQNVNEVIKLLQGYTKIEQSLSSLFREAQYALDVIDSERRVNKSEFDDVEYKKAKELAEIKGSIENGTYETADGVKFSVKINEQIIEIIFDKYERTKDFQQLQKDLRALGRVVPAEASEYVSELKQHYLDLIRQEKLDLIHEGALEDAFRGANATLLKKFSELNQKYSQRLQQKIQELKKDGIKRREILKRLPSQRLADRLGIDITDVQSLVDIAFETYERNKSIPNVDAYGQLQKDLAALKDIAEIGIEITSDDAGHIAQKRAEINQAIKKGDISFDYLVFGGVLGQEFLSVSPELHEQALKIRTSYQELIKDVRKAVLADFAAEIQTEFDSFLENLHQDYAEAILQSKADILSEVEQVRDVDVESIDRNTAKTVDDAIDIELAKLKLRIAEQTETNNTTARAIAKLTDRAISWTLKNIFRRTKDTDALITKQKAADVTLPSAEREIVTREEIPAVFPVQVVNINKDQRTVEDKKAVVDVVEEISVKDGKLVFTSPTEAQQDMEEEVKVTVNGNILGYETVDGKKTMKLELDSLDKAGDALIVALKAYSAAGRAGSIDIDNIELVVGGREVAKMYLSKTVLFQIMNEDRGEQLNNILKNGGMMEVNGELIVVGKNSQGIMEAHNIGTIEKVNPDVMAIFEMKKLAQKVSFFQLVQMSQEEKSKFFAENPIARHPLFMQVLTQDVKVEDGVILIGNNDYTKGNVGKGTVLVNSRLGKNVKVGENSFIMDSEIGTLKDIDSSIGDSVEIKNVKIGSFINAGNGAKINTLIANELIAGEQALLERVNSSKHKIVIGDRSVLLDFEGEALLTMLDDQFKQGSEKAVSYGSSNMEEIIIRDTGALLKGIKFLQRKFGEWSMNLQKDDPKSKSAYAAVRLISELTSKVVPRKFLSGFFGALYNFIGQKILPEGRQWAALQNERSKFEEEIRERFKDQRERLQNDLKTPSDLLFALDPNLNFPSDVIAKLSNIAQLDNPAERKEQFDAYLNKMFADQPQEIRDKLSLFFEDVIQTAQKENKNIEDVFQDKIFEITDNINEQLKNIDSLEKLSEFEAFAKLFAMYYPDLTISTSLSRDVAVRGYELAQTGEAKDAFLIKALNFNKVLIGLDPSDKKPIDLENDFLSKLNINPETLAESLQTQLSKIHSGIVANLIRNENISEDIAKTIADKLVLMIGLNSNSLPLNIDASILQRQILRITQENKDKFSLLTSIQISPQGEFNAGFDTVDLEALSKDLDNIGIRLQDLLDSLNISGMDSTAKWADQQDVWEMNLIRGKELYKDAFFDNVRTVLKNLSVPARNAVTRALLDSYSKTGSSVNLMSDLKRVAMDIEKSVGNGEYSGKVLQMKLQEAIGALKILSVMEPFDYANLALLSDMMIKMSETELLLDINNLTKDELIDALISAKIVNSRQDAVNKAGAIIKQRQISPITSIDDISIEGWGAAELERLRNANIAGSQGSTEYYKSSAMQIAERALVLAKEADDKFLITVLSMRQAEHLLEQPYVQADKLKALLDDVKDRIPALADRNLRNQLQEKYDFFNLKLVAEQKKNVKDEKDRAELISILDKFKKSNPYYADVLMMKAGFMEQWENTEAADEIYRLVIGSFPEHADKAQLKIIERVLKAGGDIEFMRQASPTSAENEKQAVSILKRLREAINNKSISNKAQFIETVFGELLNWQISAEENALSDTVVSEILQTMALLNIFVTDSISQNMSDPQKANSVNRLIQLQDQINSTLFDFHSVSDNSFLDGIIQTSLDSSWVDMEGKIKTQAPVVAVIRDNMDMDQLDSSGFLGNEVNKMKIDKLTQFVQLINPDAKVSFIGDHIVVTGLSDLQLSLFNNMLAHGQEKALEMMEYTIMRRIQDLFDDKDLTAVQIASALALEFGLNAADAQDIASLKGAEVSEIKEKLHNKIYSLSRLDSLSEQQIAKLNELFSADLQSSVVALINQKINKLKAEEAGEEQLKVFEDLLETVTSKSLFNVDNYHLVIGKAAVPSYYAPLAELLNKKEVATYKIKLSQLIEKTQSDIDDLENRLSELSAMELAGLARLKERVKEFKILENATDLETFNNFIKNRTNLVQDIFAEALENFKIQEKNEQLRLEKGIVDGVNLTTPEAVNNPSDLNKWVHIWNSITDKQFKNQFSNEYRKAIQSRDTFQYLRKLLQGATPAELAPLRNKMIANLRTYLGPQLGSQMASVIVQMIEQNNGNVDKTLAVFQQFGPQLVQTVKGFFVKDTSKPVTLDAVYELYSERLKEMSGLTLDRKTQELNMDEENLFTPSQITVLRDLGVKNPFTLSASEVKIMRDLLDKMDAKKQVIEDWLNENGIGKSEQRSVIAEAVMKIHGVGLGAVSPVQAQKIQQMIPALDLKLYVHTDNKAYMIPQLDPANPSDMSFIKRALQYSGIENADEFLEQAAERVKLPKDELIFPNSMFDLIDGYKKRTDLTTADEYLAELFDDVAKSAGFMAFEKRDTEAAGMVKEFMDSIKYRRSINPNLLNLEGIQFIARVFLNQRVLTRLINEDSKRVDAEYIKAIRIMFTKTTEIFEILLNDQTNMRYKRELADFMEELKEEFNILNEKFVDFGLEFDSERAVKDETIDGLQSEFIVLDNLIDRIIRKDARIRIEASIVDEQTAIEELIKTSDDHEIYLMQICLKNLFARPMVAISELSDAEKQDIAGKFFRQVQFNKNRLDLFISMLDEIFASGYLNTGSIDDVQYSRAVENLRARIRNYERKYSAKQAVGTEFPVAANIPTSFDERTVAGITDKIEGPLRDKVKALLEQLSKNINIDIVQNKLKIDPVLERVLNEISTLSGRNVKNDLYNDRLKGLFSALFDQALEASIADKALFPNTFAFLNLNGLRDADKIRDALIEYMLNIYIDAPMSNENQALFANVDENVKNELINFLETKMPEFNKVRNQETSTDKRVILAQVFQEKLGNTIFDIGSLSTESQAVIRNFLFEDIRPYVTQQKKDNQYVFIVNFDALTSSGKIDVNESNFILKETMAFLEETARTKGKDVKFVVVSDKYDSTHVTEQLSVLRVSEIQVDVFAKDLGTGNKTLAELIDVVRNNYLVDTDKLKLITGQGNTDARKVAFQEGIQIMEIDPDAAIEKTESGEIFAQTVVGALNLIVRGTMDNFESLPETTKVISFRTDMPKKAEMEKLIIDFKGSFNEDLLSNPDFIKRLKEIFGMDLSEAELLDAFYETLIAYILEQMQKANIINDQFNIKLFEKAFKSYLKDMLGSNDLFGKLFPQSIFNLVLQPPKQKISNTYLREYEKMKMAEEFA